MATSEDKGYDLDSYRQRVMDKMQAEQEKTDESKCNEKPQNSRNVKKKTNEELMYGTIKLDLSFPYCNKH